MTIENSTLSKHVKATYDLNLGQLYFLDNIVVSEFKEGAHVTIENTKELYQLIKKHFGTNPFGYVSNRINDYSVSPTDYLLCDKENNIAAFGIVCYNGNNKSNTAIENTFAQHNIQIFESLYDATIWAYDSTKALITK